MEDAGRKKELRSLQYFSRVKSLYRDFSTVLLLLLQNISVGQFVWFCGLGWFFLFYDFEVAMNTV